MLWFVTTRQHGARRPGSRTECLNRPIAGKTQERRRLRRADGDGSARGARGGPSPRTGRAALAEVLEIEANLRVALRRGLSRTERQQLAGTLLRLQENLADVLSVDGNSSGK